MYCPYCGKTIELEASFCPFCGKAIKQSAGKNVEDYSPTLGEFQYINDYNLSPYYQRVFKKFDANNGKFVFAWNWLAFLFGAIWYLVKGLWAKALIMIAISIILGGLPAPLFWFYCAIFGNYDYYLLKRKKTQLWG